MAVKIRRGSVRDAQLSTKLIEVPVKTGIPSAEELSNEIFEYVDIMLGRKDAPLDSPYLALAECATAYYARAQEIDMMIHAAERTGDVMKGSPLYKFRTGELRSFIELSRKVAELGSRRLTQEQLLEQQKFEE